VSQATVGERILVHLSSYLRFADAFECPRDVTQEGIAEAVRISRAHAALELKRLRGSRRVEERMAHVLGAKTRRKVYVLSHTGASHARALRDLVREKRVLLVDAGDRREVRGDDAVLALRQRGARESEALQLVLTSDVLDLREVRPASWTPDVPVPRPFVDREQELAALKAWLASPAPVGVVLGIAGVGKTSLAAMAAAAFEGPVWYRKVYGFEDARTFAAGLGDFLRRIDRPRLRNYLASGRFDSVELSTILQTDLRRVLLLIDDVHASPEAVGFLRLAAEAAPDGKILVTSREQLEGFADAGQHPPFHLVLGGLSADAARVLCRHLLGRAEGTERIVTLSRGHPLALRILANAHADETQGEAERLLEDAIFGGLDPGLERALGVLAVLRKPIERPALLGVSPTQLRQLLRKGLAIAGSGYAVHDLVRDVLLPRVPPPAIRAAHRAAATAASKRGDRLEEAFHLDAAGKTGRAREVLLSNSTQLLDSPSVGELARLLERLPATPRSRLVLAEAWDRIGRTAEAQSLVKSLASSPQHGLRGETLLLLGRIASRTNALRDARSYLAEAIATATVGRNRTLEGLARKAFAQVLRKGGDLAGADRELSRAVEILDITGPARERVRARLERATIRLQAGDLTIAAGELEALAGDPANGPREEAAIRSNLAIARFRMSRPMDAADLFEASARAAEQGGDFRVAGYALANATDAYLAAGRIEAADLSLRRARDFAAPFADPLLESTLLTNEGKVLAARGMIAGAEERLRAGVERIRHTGNTPSLAERIHEIATFYETLGRHDEAREWKRELEDLGRETSKATNE